MESVSYCLTDTAMPQAQKTAHISDRRSGGGVGVAVHFTSDTDLKMKKDEFLCNKENKQLFIHLLTGKLEQCWCEVHQASGHADVLIIKTTVACSDKQNTVLIGADTDHLVLRYFVFMPQIHSTMSFSDQSQGNTPKDHQDAETSEQPAYGLVTL
jgi:hypothetical protein